MARQATASLNFFSLDPSFPKSQFQTPDPRQSTPNTLKQEKQNIT